MNTALKMKLEEMNRRLNEALDTDLFEESESEFNEFQAEVDSFERESWRRYRSSGRIICSFLS